MSSNNLLRESVSLTLVQGEERIDRTAIIQALGQLIPVTEIDALGNLGDFNEWFVICKSQTTREKLLKTSDLNVGEQMFTISEPYKHVKVIRLMNIPPTVPEEDVRAVVSKWGGTILSTEHEKMPHPYEGIKTFVRRIRIRFSCQQDEQKVPFSIRYNGLNIMVYLEGRKKVCYRCKQVGHIKADCPVPVCRKCRGVGHDDPVCRLRHTYATALISTPNNVNTTPSLVQELDAIESNGAENHRGSPIARREPVRNCRHCKKAGHLRKNCPERAREEIDLNHLEPGAGVERSESTPQSQANENTDEPILPMNSQFEYDKPRSEAEVNKASEVEQPNVNVKKIPPEQSSGRNDKDLDNGRTDPRKLYEEYKNPNSKRGLADRSLEAEPDAIKKKVNNQGKSTSAKEVNKVNESEN